MCYPKPGPRCSNYAKGVLITANKEWEKAQTDAARTVAMVKVKRAEEEYDTTPAGQKDLSLRISYSNDPDGLYSARLEHGIANRKFMLRMIKAVDVGDVGDVSSAEGEHNLSKDRTHTWKIGKFTVGSVTLAPSKTPHPFLDTLTFDPHQRHLVAPVTPLVGGRPESERASVEINNFGPSHDVPYEEGWTEGIADAKAGRPPKYNLGDYGHSYIAEGYLDAYDTTVAESVSVAATAQQILDECADPSSRREMSIGYIESLLRRGLAASPTTDSRL